MVAPPDGAVAVSIPPTLADLAADPGELIASCRNCHHDAVLPVAPVLARYGPMTPFLEVKGRFRCSACGQQTGMSARRRRTSLTKTAKPRGP
jgi:hypothetical protein